MLVRVIALTVFALALIAYQANADITMYGDFNYKLSHDENTSGVAYHKLEDNGSKIGWDFSSSSIDGSSLGGFAKLEIGVDTDDSGSDTFDSRLAYVGLSSSVGDISLGRQSHPFTDNIGGKTNVFNVYGSSADFNYGVRSSNSVAYSHSANGLTVDALAIADGSSGDANAFDEYEYTISADVLGSSVSLGFADDVVNDISYWGAAATTEVGPITLGTSYTIKDTTTDLAGVEVTAKIDGFTVGYGDKEGTGNYTTVGVSHSLVDDLSIYAETQLTSPDTGVDTQSYSIGTKFSF